MANGECNCRVGDEGGPGIEVEYQGGLGGVPGVTWHHKINTHWCCFIHLEHFGHHIRTDPLCGVVSCMDHFKTRVDGECVRSIPHVGDIEIDGDLLVGQNRIGRRG